MSETRTKLPTHNLDLLRSIAVLMVLGDHLGIAILAPGWRTTCAAFGRFGVLIFFVHTSLVLMSSLERQGPRPDWVRAFYLRRAFRIYPLAIAAIGLVLALQIPDGIPRISSNPPFSSPSLSTLLANLALVQNVAARPQVLAPLWSLPIEVQMYLLLPGCWILARKGGRYLLGLLAVLIAAFAVVAYAPIPFVWRLTVFLFGPCFFGGVYAYSAFRRGARQPLPPWALYLVIGAGAAALFVLHSTDATPVRNWIPCLIVGGSLPLIRDARESIVTLAASRIAKYSYGLYLLHIPALWIAFVLLAGRSGTVEGLAFVGSLSCMAWLAYHLIEAPLIRFAQRLVTPTAPGAELSAAPIATGA